MVSINLKNFYTWPKLARYFIFVVIFLIVFYLGYVWHLSNLIGEIETAKQQQVELQTQLESAIDKESAFSKELTQLTQLKSQEKLWEKNIVSYDDLPKVMNDILKIGADNQLNFISFDPAPEQQGLFYYKTPIKIITLGSYNQIGGFLSQLMTLPITVSIKDFTISNEIKPDVVGDKLAKLATESNWITMETYLDIYHQPLPEKIKETTQSTTEKTKPKPTPTPTENTKHEP